MTVRWLLASAGLLAIVLAGCAGSRFARQADETLVLGRTTQQEILQRLGSPYREGVVTKNEQQLKTASYAYAAAGGTALHAGVTPARSQAFYFLGDRPGRV